jgi:membrane fusion protein (multidrug efflux system)
MVGGTLVRQRSRELAVAEARVTAAAAAVEVARVNLSRTTIRAPADGWITNRTVEVGQVVQPNQPLLALTLAYRVWVVANIKEAQLAGIRIGNPVRITVDARPGRVFHGHVQSIQRATGSSTTLLPPDNATGNFVKVVQLVPVWIALDDNLDPDPLLAIGLSVEVTIDTRRGGS